MSVKREYKEPCCRPLKRVVAGLGTNPKATVVAVPEFGHDWVHFSIHGTPHYGVSMSVDDAEGFACGILQIVREQRGRA